MGRTRLVPEFYRLAGPKRTFPVRRLRQSASKPRNSRIPPRAPTARSMIESRFDVVTSEQLEALVARPIPGAPAVAPVSLRYRDLYLDSADELLERRGITCRLRVGSDDTR